MGDTPVPIPTNGLPNAETFRGYRKVDLEELARVWEVEEDLPPGLTESQMREFLKEIMDLAAYWEEIEWQQERERRKKEWARELQEWDRKIAAEKQERARALQEKEQKWARELQEWVRKIAAERGVLSQDEKLEEEVADVKLAHAGPVEPLEGEGVDVKPAHGCAVRPPRSQPSEGDDKAVVQKPREEKPEALEGLANTFMAYLAEGAVTPKPEALEGLADTFMAYVAEGAITPRVLPYRGCHHAEGATMPRASSR